MDNEFDSQLAELKAIAAELDGIKSGVGTSAFTSGMELAKVHLNSTLTYLKLERQIKQSTNQTQGNKRTLPEIAAEIDTIQDGTGTAAFSHGLTLICERLSLALNELQFKKQIDALNEQTREIQRMMSKWR